ncbi:MAG: hypothetical protein K6E76_02750 [Patescibacteria group bacterium]|nr:hypothetical protein [Patescibacteria group bacterium]
MYIQILVIYNIMKKTLFLFLLFGISGITFAESFPDFPMTLYGDIKVGTTVLSS